MTNSTISGNSADGDGGGIFSRLGDVTMIGSTLSGNSASHGNGGGLYVFDAASAIRHSTVTGNSAGIGGGGAFIFGGSLALDHTILAANSRTALGPDLTGLIGTALRREIQFDREQRPQRPGRDAQRLARCQRQSDWPGGARPSR